MQRTFFVRPVTKKMLPPRHQGTKFFFFAVLRFFRVSRRDLSGYFHGIAHLLYPLYLAIAKSIRTQPLLIRCLFKVRLHNEKNISWDFTTLILKRALRKRIKPNMSALEIGVGRAGGPICWAHPSPSLSARVSIMLRNLKKGHHLEVLNYLFSYHSFTSIKNYLDRMENSL